VATEFKPEGYQTVTPYLVVQGADRLIEFIQQALGAEERSRMPGPNGTIGHAELQIGDSVVMLADAPGPGDVMPAMLSIYVEDADVTYQRALQAGATSLREPRTEFYGDRMAAVQDFAGNKWYFATHVEDVSEEEMQRRAAELSASGEQGSTDGG
jgi:PhnB protein